MELKATSLGKRLAQHPYDRVTLLNAGVRVSGDKHEYLIPFNQLLAINCKRGLVWGELEFMLPQNKVVRLHGTEWPDTQRFYHHLAERWQTWSDEMSVIAAGVLTDALSAAEVSDERWLKRDKLASIHQHIRTALVALPLPEARLPEFENCRELWQQCEAWLQDKEEYRQAHNQRFTNTMLRRHAEFFNHIESSPLDLAQARAVVNGEESLLVLAGAGSGKTSVLVARAGWLLLQKDATPEQILLLAFGRHAAQEMNERVVQRLHTEAISACTFHALALHIISQSSRKIPQLTELENDTEARYQFLVDAWQMQCHEKKAQQKGWRQWLSSDADWDFAEDAFWQDKRLVRWLAPRLDRWLALMRMHGGAQAQMIAEAPDALREQFSKLIKLMAPLLKAWKTRLKAEGTVDFSGLIHQAVSVLDKGRFVSPWMHILVDEFQDLSPQRAALLAALRRQNRHTSLFAVGDDWQAIYRFSGAQLSLITAFQTYYGAGDEAILDTSYRFNSRIGEVASRFIQQNPAQLKKPLNSLTTGDSKAVTLLPDSQLEALLDKLSGYVTLQQRILVMARYHYQRPSVLQKAQTRWPNLAIDFMTIHASKGQQAEFAIVVGLQAGKDGFPAAARESIIEQVLLPKAEDFSDAEERRLLYVALTRARQRVWLLFDNQQPSIFVETLKQLGVPVARRP